jgi:hypothetical protein
LRKTKPNIDTLDKSHCICRIPFESSRECIGETGRPLNISIRHHKYNLREGYVDKCKLASHAFDEGHRIDWINMKIFQSEPITIYRKYKEAAPMFCTNNPISQPGLDISSLWFPLIAIDWHTWIGIQ